MKYLFICGGKFQQGMFTRLTGISSNGVILKLTYPGFELVKRIEYRSPGEYCADNNPSILFKAGSIEGDKLYACTTTEVLIYNTGDLSLDTHLSNPFFNDVHHVKPLPNGNMLVAVTGLDMVVEIDRNGTVIHKYYTCETKPGPEFCSRTDYRKINSLKPHQAHPNFIFRSGNEYWVTRFIKGDALSLSDSSKRINLDASAGPHDGVVFKGKIYFTTVDGFIIIVSETDHKVISRINLAEVFEERRALGWCRGITIPDEEHAIVGFTTTRSTKIKENVKWIADKLGAFSHALPARISVINIRKKKAVRTEFIEKYGINAVFSVGLQSQ